MSKESPDAPAQPAAETPAPARAPRRWLMPVLILAGVAAAAVAVALFVLRPLFPPPAASAPPPKAETFGRVVPLDAVVVNLAQSEGRRYLKVSVHLEVPDEEKVAKEVEQRKPQLLDLLVATLTQKSLADVTAPDALGRLRDEVQQRAGQELGPGKVRRVFITEFVVQ
ncbi:MAG: flagellar basal body-associated protein FliL [Candidatus Methylomirabilales bacterium]